MSDDDGEQIIARWKWLYEYDEDPPGGFSFGQFKLRADGVVLRGYGDRVERWEEVSWWPGEIDPHRAAQLLHARGYELSDL